MRVACLCCMAGWLLPAQGPPPQPITAPGAVSFHEGGVFISTLSEQMAGRPVLKQGGEIGTRGDGFVEVLLTPGTLAWLAPASQILLESSAPDETILVLQKGALLAEALPVAGTDPAVFVWEGRRITLRPGTLARIDGLYGLLRVLKGAASVEEKSRTVNVAAGMELAFATGSAPTKAARRRDPLQKRCRERAERMSAANAAGARWVFKTRTPWPRDAWLWVEDLGEFTFIPAAGRIQSALGPKFWSPSTVHSAGGPAYDSTAEQMREAGMGRTTALPQTSGPRPPAPPPPPPAAGKK